MLSGPDDPSLEDPRRAPLRAARCRDETTALQALLPRARLDPAANERVQAHAWRLAAQARRRVRAQGGADALLREYDLSNEEGVLLMCLAEALLRIPDAATAECLIEDVLGRGQWDRHLGRSPSLLVNASTWGLLLTGRVLRLDPALGGEPAGVLRRLVARSGEKLARLALAEAMGLLARRFVLGRDMSEALGRSRPGQRYSYDCLGEAARTAAAARRYLAAYQAAVAALAGRPGAELSVKLSALHPRYGVPQGRRVRTELLPALTALLGAARAAGVAVTIDAEEVHLLEPSLDLFEALVAAPDLAGWDGLGLAVQAYQTAAPALLEWLAEVARGSGRRVPVRLVKGAYWDSEIKRAQELGLAHYPVYTRKAATDTAYLACARYLLEHRDLFHPRFATHNAHTVAWVLEAAGGTGDYEFQRLHGMGEALYDAVAAESGEVPVRIYAPVGGHQALLPYLVRRLLENGANSSFVNQLGADTTPIDVLTTDPAARLAAVECRPHPRIPLPPDLYGTNRRNARGIDLTAPGDILDLTAGLAPWRHHRWRAAPLVGGATVPGAERAVTEPADRCRTVGLVVEADADTVTQAVDLAAAAAPGWDREPAANRAAVLAAAADRLEANAAELLALVVREGGRTLPDALAELREAVDFCRYYALAARRDFTPRSLPGPTGERNELTCRGRGVFACISPWNFPLAIFTGQVAAALAAGNAVLAKPARQTALVAHRVVELLQEAGVPPDVLHLLPGEGAAIGARLLADPRLAGVAMTGSVATARVLQRQLADRDGPIVPLIAETGGQNVMVVDSSALHEQVVDDVLRSAFNSAGQRCSALRVLFLQQDIADELLDMLTGAMDELAIGDPMCLATDIGPVIDTAAVRGLREHAERMAREGRVLKVLPVPHGCRDGDYFAPHLFEIDSLARLEREVFGPILHVVRYPAGGLDAVIDAVNATGYGLTLGVHSRIESVWQRVRERARVGNLYVNRNMIGAVVGVQPFGGEGLSGTGPKAGGPDYLRRFAVERAVSVNIAALGGNAGLLGLGDDLPEANGR